MSQKGTLPLWTPRGVVSKDNFKNFFQMTTFFLAYVVTFFRTGTFYEKLLLHSKHLHSSYFSRVTSFSEQLLFWGTFLLQNTYFFSAVILSKQLLNHSKTSKDKLLLENRQFFRTASFSEQFLFRKKNLFRISISTEKFLFRSRQF